MNDADTPLPQISPHPANPRVLYSEVGRLAWVELNRPMSANSIDRAMVSELHAIWLSLRDRTDVEAVILTGTGTEAFTVGLDSTLTSVDPPPEQRIGPREHGVKQYLVVAINGIACREADVFLRDADVVVAAQHTSLRVAPYRRHRGSATRCLSSDTRRDSTALSTEEALARNLIDEAVPLSALRQRAEFLALTHIGHPTGPPEESTERTA